jgi:hypothetical protein
MLRNLFNEAAILPDIISEHKKSWEELPVEIGSRDEN